MLKGANYIAIHLCHCVSSVSSKQCKQIKRGVLPATLIAFLLVLTMKHIILSFKMKGDVISALDAMIPKRFSGYGQF